MSRWFWAAAWLLVSAQSLVGCSSVSTGESHTQSDLNTTLTPITWVRVGQQLALESYEKAKGTIPPQPPESVRLIIYRPQGIVGMFGKAIVIVNGKWMGNPADPIRQNMLLPASVFVVDVPTDVVRVWWVQAGRGEEVDKALELSSAKARTWYLRWSMKPEYGYLDPVDEERAKAELTSLRFSGYVNLDAL